MSEAHPSTRENLIQAAYSLKFIVGMTGVSLGIGAGAGALYDQFESNHDIYNAPEVGVHDYETYRTFIEETETLVKDKQAYELRYANLESEVGSACVSALELYIAGKPLGETPTDSIVDDMLNTTGTPCGDEPTEVRYSVTEVRDVISSYNELSAIDINEKLVYAKELQEADAQNTIDENDRTPAKEGLKIGLLIGLIGSTISELQFRKANKGKIALELDEVWRQGIESRSGHRFYREELQKHKLPLIALYRLFKNNEGEN